MTQLIFFLHFLLIAVRTGRLGVLQIKIYQGNNAVFVSFDLIGEKNQVILELTISFCGASKAKYHIGITVCIVCLSCFTFAGSHMHSLNP